jgi:hypothetical protein
VEAIAGKCINEMSNDIDSFSTTRQVSDIQYDLSTDEDFRKSPDACEVEIPVSDVLTGMEIEYHYFGIKLRSDLRGLNQSLLNN